MSSTPSTPTSPPTGSSSSSAPTRDQTSVVGARIAAQLVDIILMTVQLFAVAFFLGGVLGLGRGAFFLGLLTLPLYGGLFEGYWNGQTAGKALLGIRVVDEAGRPCSVGQAFIRNLPAVVMPGWLVYLVALASMAASDRRQRVFDHVAETVVVRA